MRISFKRIYSIKYFQGQQNIGGTTRCNNNHIWCWRWSTTAIIQITVALTNLTLLWILRINAGQFRDLTSALRSPPWSSQSPPQSRWRASRPLCRGCSPPPTWEGPPRGQLRPGSRVLNGCRHVSSSRPRRRNREDLLHRKNNPLHRQGAGWRHICEWGWEWRDL